MSFRLRFYGLNLFVAVMLFSCGGSGGEVATTGSPATGTEGADLFRAMRGGGFVIYFRHADADVGQDTRADAPAGWWMSCDSTLARQISDKGRDQASETGARLAGLGLPLKGVFTSEFCRCQATAQAMALDGLPIMTARELTGGVYDEKEPYRAILQFAQDHGDAGSVLVLVGHSIHSGDDPPDLAMGDAAVYRWRQDGPPAFVNILSPGEWPMPNESGK